MDVRNGEKKLGKLDMAEIKNARILWESYGCPHAHALNLLPHYLVKYLYEQVKQADMYYMDLVIQKPLVNLSGIY